MNIALATLAALLFHIASYLPEGVGSWVAQNLGEEVGKQAATATRPPSRGGSGSILNTASRAIAQLTGNG